MTKWQIVHGTQSLSKHQTQKILTDQQKSFKKLSTMS